MKALIYSLLSAGSIALVYISSGKVKDIWLSDSVVGSKSATASKNEVEFSLEELKLFFTEEIEGLKIVVEKGKGLGSYPETLFSLDTLFLLK